MKNKVLPILALVCALAALVLSAAAFRTARLVPDPSRKLDALEAQNEALQAQVDALSAKLSQAPAKIGLRNWTLVPTAIPDINAADIAFTATPLEPVDGLQANLVVDLNGQAAANVPCSFIDGTFTASVELPAANGYAYYCVLTDSDGGEKQIPLVTPEKPDDILINLADSLSVYCNLAVDNHSYDEDTLTIKGCYLQLQLPQLTAGGSAPEYSRSQLVLCLNGDALSNQTVVLEPGEADSAFEQSLGELSFPVPVLEEGDMLELWLEVTLSDGTVITASGASWFWESGELLLAVG